MTICLSHLKIGGTDNIKIKTGYRFEAGFIGCITNLKMSGLQFSVADSVRGASVNKCNL